MSTFETKLAHFQEEQERGRNKPMSKHIRRSVAKKLKETIDATTDPMVIAALANQLAKYLPKPKQPRRGRGAQSPNSGEETLDMGKLCAAIEKKRRERKESAEVA